MMFGPGPGAPLTITERTKRARCAKRRDWAATSGAPLISRKEPSGPVPVGSVVTITAVQANNGGDGCHGDSCHGNGNGGNN